MVGGRAFEMVWICRELLIFFFLRILRRESLTFWKTFCTAFLIINYAGEAHLEFCTVARHMKISSVVVKDYLRLFYCLWTVASGSDKISRSSTWLITCFQFLCKRVGISPVVGLWSDLMGIWTIIQSTSWDSY